MVCKGLLTCTECQEVFFVYNNQQRYRKKGELHQFLQNC